MSSSDYSSSKTQKSKSRFNPYRKRMFDVLIRVACNEDSSDFLSSLLYDDLQNAGVYMFEDDKDRRSGELTLRGAIAESRISIIVFTKNYAASTWFLQDLEKIMECRRTVGQQIVPVFHFVDPSKVGKQTAHVGEAFASIDRKSTNDENKVLNYSTALQEAAGISPRFATDWGYSCRDRDYPIKSIVEQVTSLLDSADLFVAEHPVGVQSRAQKAIQILNCHKSDDVLLLGIWGMGGIGKTTVAKAIYNQISHNFGLRKFLPDLRYRSVSLIEELFTFAVRKTAKILRFAPVKGKALKTYLSGKRSIFVFDNVNDSGHMEELLGLREWYGPGSRIIITTRNKEVLRSLRVDHIYKVDEMDYNECVELFSWYAFQKATPERNFAGLLKHVVEYSDGLPLALVALGSTLFERNIEEWESELDRLKRFPIQDVKEVLKISIDDLKVDGEKQIFLELANLSYFFIGMDRNDIIQILKRSGYVAASSEIELLEDQSLVTIDKNDKLRMHPLLQDLGREIYQKQSSIKPQQRTYDVFLSFRGKDTRSKFTSHLHASLENAGIYVFKDDDGFSRGQQLSLLLLKAIGESKISIIVLSTNYADSRWCLQELEDIMICYRTKAQKVLPVFYDVEPSEVRNQVGKFGQAFEDLIKRIPDNKDKEQSWRKALREVGCISGFVILKSRNESEDIKKIVEHVTHMLDMKDLFIANHPVGVESRVQDVIKLLMNQPSKNPLFLGILGMGGIGKTTIAKAIFNKICRKFEGRCFLLNIREVWDQDNGCVYLQEQLLSDIYETLKIKIRNIESGKSILKKRLHEKRILLVLDDVDKLEQLNALAASQEWFCPRSVIIITTRDEHILNSLGVDKLYRMDTLDDEESIELFSWHAFKEPCPGNEFSQLSSKVISYCGRLPLALEVIGSHLFNRGVIEWKSVLKKLKSIPHEQVQKKLKISFAGLSLDDREIFLDIAFFFIGMDKVDAIHILDGCGHPTTIGISVLIEKCLVYVDNKNKLRMHDLLRDMGREIIREELPKAPGKRSRVWHPEEVRDLLSKDMGTKAIEGLALKLPMMNPIHLNTEAFKNMKRLKLLQLAGVYLDGDFKYISTDLRCLCWHGCPSTYTTANFDQGNLVSIDLKYSNLQLVWKKGQRMEMLKVLNLSHSKHLTKTPDFSYLPNLEKLILKYCPSLSSVSHTIRHLKKVLLINLKGCTSLRVLPRSIYLLKSLKTLIISGCSNLGNLEEDLEQMDSLTIFKADDTSITQVPHALIRLKSIRYISLCGFDGLTRNVIPSIIWSWTSPTNNLSPQIQAFVESSCLASIIVSKSSFNSTSSSVINEPPQFRKRVRFEYGSQLQTTADVALFNIRNFKEEETMVTASHISNMATSVIFLDSCSQGDITGSKNPLGSILIQMGVNCPVTEILTESISKDFSGSVGALGECLLPGDNDPDWSTFSSEGFSMFFYVPLLKGRNLKTMMLYVVYSSSLDIITSEGLILKEVLIINHTKATAEVCKGDTLTSLRDEDWQRVISNLEPGDKVQVVTVLEYGFIVKKTAVYLIYEEPVDQSVEHCHADVFVSCSNNTVSGGDDGVAVDMNKNASGVDGMAARENVTTSSVDDMIADMNKNNSGVEVVVADRSAIVSDEPTDNNDDIISGGDEKKLSFCRHSNKRRKFDLISRCKQRGKWLVESVNKLFACKKANKAQCFKLCSRMQPKLEPTNPFAIIPT